MCSPAHICILSSSHQSAKKVLGSWSVFSITKLSKVAKTISDGTEAIAFFLRVAKGFVSRYRLHVHGNTPDGLGKQGDGRIIIIWTKVVVFEKHESWWLYLSNTSVTLKLRHSHKNWYLREKLNKGYNLASKKMSKFKLLPKWHTHTNSENYRDFIYIAIKTTCESKSVRYAS